MRSNEDLTQPKINKFLRNTHKKTCLKYQYHANIKKKKKKNEVYLYCLLGYRGQIEEVWLWIGSLAYQRETQAGFFATEKNRPALGGVVSPQPETSFKSCQNVIMKPSAALLSPFLVSKTPAFMTFPEFQRDSC